MSELIPISEVARRIGVSGTAVRKAIESGRIRVASTLNNTKLFSWPEVGEEYQNNTSTKMRAHYGSQGGLSRSNDEPQILLETKQDVKINASQPRINSASRATMTINEIQRERELVKLELDELKLNEARGELVSAQKVKDDMAKLAAIVKSGLMNIPDRISAQIAGMNQPHEIHALIKEEINLALAELGRKVS
jgi:hypothetical protein